MNREEIIRMALEFGWSDCDKYKFDIDELQEFADAICAAEREACAKLCNDADKSTHPSDLAETIRARGNK